jgi:inosine/xanthosine triphosphate pyrophosphatase family protein
MTIKRLLLGTTNTAKVHIIRAALESLPIKVITLEELNIRLSVKEDGKSTEDNAQSKARAYFTASHVPTLAIDGGLCIDRFPADKQPDTFVRRIYREDRDATDEEVLEYYRRELEAVGGESPATWRGAMALALGPDRMVAETFFFDAILTSRRHGKPAPGAPLDALTIDPATGKYYTEMSWQERAHTHAIGKFVRRYMDEF